LKCQFCNNQLSNRVYTKYPCYSLTCLHCPIQVSYNFDIRNQTPISFDFLLYEKGSRYSININTILNRCALYKQDGKDRCILQLSQVPNLSPQGAHQYLKRLLKQKAFS
jgi:hypothetical protein